MNREDIKQEIESLFHHMGFEGGIEGIEINNGATNRFNVRLLHDASMLIGEKGNNLAAIEHIVKKVIRCKQNGEYPQFTLDINNYRLKRLDDLKEDVKTAARTVRVYQRDVPLRSMSPFERRIVHLLLAEYPDITTESIGREPERRVIIRPLA